MKKIFILAIAIQLVSCKSEKETINPDLVEAEKIKNNMIAFSIKDEEYSKFPAYIKFLNEKELKENNQGLIAERKAFVESSGLPNSTNFLDWKSSHTINDAIEIYKQFCFSNKDNNGLFVFKQYGPWLILTKLKLLSQSDDKSLQNIKYLVDELISAEYSGFALLHYSLDFLLKNNYDKNSIAFLTAKVVNYASKLKSNSSSWAKDDIIKQLSPNLPLEMKEKIAEGIMNGDKENQASFTKILELNEELKK